MACAVDLIWWNVRSDKFLFKKFCSEYNEEQVAVTKVLRSEIKQETHRHKEDLCTYHHMENEKKQIMQNRSCQL